MSTNIPAHQSLTIPTPAMLPKLDEAEKERTPVIDVVGRRVIDESVYPVVPTSSNPLEIAKPKQNFNSVKRLLQQMQEKNQGLGACDETPLDIFKKFFTKKSNLFVDQFFQLINCSSPPMDCHYILVIISQLRQLDTLSLEEQVRWMGNAFELINSVKLAINSQQIRMILNDISKVLPDDLKFLRQQVLSLFTPEKKGEVDGSVLALIISRISMLSGDELRSAVLKLNSDFKPGMTDSEIARIISQTPQEIESKRLLQSEKEKQLESVTYGVGLSALGKSPFQASSGAPNSASVNSPASSSLEVDTSILHDETLATFNFLFEEALASNDQLKAATLSTQIFVYILTKENAKCLDPLREMRVKLAVLIESKSSRLSSSHSLKSDEVTASSHTAPSIPSSKEVPNYAAASSSGSISLQYEASPRDEIEDIETFFEYLLMEYVDTDAQVLETRISRALTDNPSGEVHKRLQNIQDNLKEVMGQNKGNSNKTNEKLLAYFREFKSLMSEKNGVDERKLDELRLKLRLLSGTIEDQGRGSSSTGEHVSAELSADDLSNAEGLIIQISQKIKDLKGNKSQPQHFASSLSTVPSASVSSASSIPVNKEKIFQDPKNFGTRFNDFMISVLTLKKEEAEKQAKEFEKDLSLYLETAPDDESAIRTLKAFTKWNSNQFNGIGKPSSSSEISAAKIILSPKKILEAFSVDMSETKAQWASKPVFSTGELLTIYYEWIGYEGKESDENEKLRTRLLFEVNRTLELDKKNTELHDAKDVLSEKSEVNPHMSNENSIDVNEACDEEKDEAAWSDGDFSDND